MGDCVDYAIRRDHDRGNAGTLIESVSERIEGANLRLGVVVEAIGFIVGDDNGALRPILAAGDRVDGVGQKGLTDLRVGVAGVVVIARESCLNRRAGRARNEAVKVAVSAADIEDSAFRR